MSAPNTEVMVLKIRRHWRGMQTPSTDRRRYRRFDAASVVARVALIQSGPAGFCVRECDLRNVSYGGMCLETGLPLDKDARYRFLIDLGAPFSDLVLVTARVLWVGEQTQCGRQLGLQFVESSKGWLGPDED